MLPLCGISPVFRSGLARRLGLMFGLVLYIGWSLGLLFWDEVMVFWDLSTALNECNKFAIEEEKKFLLLNRSGMGERKS